MASLEAKVLSPNADLLSSVMDVVGACVYAKDHHGRYTYANEALCQLLGRPLTALLGSTAADHMDAASPAHFAALDRRVLEQGETIAGEESELTLRNGQRRVFWTSKRPLRAVHYNAPPPV